MANHESLDLRVVCAELAGVGPAGLAALVGDLRGDEVDRLTWSGDATHLRAVRQELDRLGAGETDYLVVRVGTEPVAKAGIDYVARPGRGWIWQVATHPELWGLGLATTLVDAAEQRIAAQGLGIASMGVEPDNHRARRLYDHLGYSEVGQEPTSWLETDEHGNESIYETEIIILERALRS